MTPPLSPHAAVDFLVVGGGVIGAAVAYRLAATRAGSVALCEQVRAPGAGATARSAGLLRAHHTSHRLTQLAAESLPCYQHWADVVGGDCGYRPAGFLMVAGEPHAETLAANHRAVQQHGCTSILLDSGELRARFPELATAGVAAAAYEPDSGYADPAAAACAFTAAGRRHGLRVHEGVRVHQVSTRGGRVTGVDTNVGQLPAAVVVLANGGWVTGLCPDGVSLPIEVRRIGLGEVAPPAGAATAAGPLPAGIDDTAGTYFRPTDGGGVCFGVPSDPAVTLGREVPELRAEELGAAQQRLAARLPQLARLPVTGSRVGFDAYTPDRHPAIGPAGPTGLYLTTGFSGGGFKIAPAVGELVASELVDQRASSRLEPFRPGRFATGRPLTLDAPYDHS